MPQRKLPRRQLASAKDAGGHVYHKQLNADELQSLVSRAKNKWAQKGLAAHALMVS